MAWDQRRDDWRTFRLDRLRDARLAGRRFTPREVPGGDAASSVAASIGSTLRQFEATLHIDAEPADVEDVLRWVDHTLVTSEATSCVIVIRAEDLGRLAMTVARLALTAPVEVVAPTDLADTISRLAANLVSERTATTESKQLGLVVPSTPSRDAHRSFPS